MTHPGYPRHYHGGAGYVPRLPATACGVTDLEDRVTHDEARVTCVLCLRLIAKWRAELAKLADLAKNAQPPTK